MKRKIIIAVLILFIAFLAFSPRQDILHTDVLATFQGSSSEHWLGTDNLGRDMYSLLLEGGIRTLYVVCLSTALSFFAGSFLGVVSAYKGGKFRVITDFLSDFTLVLPAFIVALIFSSLFGFSPTLAAFVFGFGGIGRYVNLAGGLTESLKDREFITAEISLGQKDWQIMLFHIFPNIYRQLLVYMGNSASGITLEYAGLAFIGLGADITNPDWGTLLYQNRIYILSHPALVIYPALAICALAVFFHLLFDRTGLKERKMTIYD